MLTTLISINPWTVVFAVICIVLIKEAFTIYKNYTKFRHIPRVYQLFSGDTLAIITAFIPKKYIPFTVQYTESAYKKHSSTVIDIVSAYDHFLLVSDAESIKTITTNSIWVKPTQLYEVLNAFGENIISTEGNLWKKHRTQFNPAFSDSNMAILPAILVKKMHEYFSIWGNNATIDALTVMTRYALSIISEAAFGFELYLDNRTLSFDKTTHKMSFQDSFRGVSNHVHWRLFVPKFLWKFPHFKDVDTFFTETELYFREIIYSKTIKPTEGRARNILDLMLNTRNEEKDSSKKLSPEEIIADTYAFMLAGHETSAHTLVMSLHLLAIHPNIQEELYTSVIESIGEGDPTYEDIHKLELAFNVFRETLRLYPTVQSFPKMCTKDTKLAGYDIPANTVVSVDVRQAHRDPSIWKNPESFDPRRWETQEANSNAKDGLFFAFSLGKRSCLGRKFAEIEAIIFLSMIVREYKIQYAPGATIVTEDDWTSRITFTPTKPITLQLTKRPTVSI